MPWTGAAFGVGCLAIAGLPPLNGFASEWLTLQSLAHLAFDGPLGVGLAGAAALAGIAATAALALLCFVKVAGLVLLGAPRARGGRDRGRGAAARCAPRWSSLAGAVRRRSASCPGCCCRRSPASRPATSASPPTRPGSALPGTGSLPALALALALVAVDRAARPRCAARRRAAPAPTWACGQPVTPALNWTSAGFTKPLRLVLEALLRPRRELEVRARGRDRAADPLRPRASPRPPTGCSTGPRSAPRSAAPRVARRLQTGNVRTYAAYLLALVLGLLALARAGALG